MMNQSVAVGAFSPVSSFEDSYYSLNPFSSYFVYFSHSDLRVLFYFFSVHGLLFRAKPSPRRKPFDIFRLKNKLISNFKDIAA